MAKRRSCGVRVVKLARSGNCAAAVRAYHKAKLHSHCSDARIGQVRGAIHACLAKGGLRDGAPPAPAAAAPAAPAAKPVAGWWPFSKKKPPAKKNPMSKRMIWEPGKPSQMFGRARRKRRR